VITKEQMLKAIESLPTDATVSDAMERLYLLDKIERGVAQLDAGQGLSHEEAQQHLAKWLE
jgi:predicted transcriptional regulator